MSVATQTKISYDEFLMWPGEDQHVEWVNGEVVPLGPVTGRHQDLDGFLLVLLRTYSEERVLGKVRTRPFQMKTAPALPGRSPDIFFVADAHLDRL